MRKAVGLSQLRLKREQNSRQKKEDSTYGKEDKSIRREGQIGFTP